MTKTVTPWADIRVSFNGTPSAPLESPSPLLTPCTKAELEAYVRARPDLEPYYTAICDPPAVFWADESGIRARYYAGDGREPEHGWAVQL